MTEFEYFCTVKVFARDHELTVPMYITDICQNDRNEKLYKKKFTRAWSCAKNETFTVITILF